MLVAAAQPQDPVARQNATTQLETMRGSNVGEYAILLLGVLSDEAKGVDLRQLAGLALKNAFTARSASGQAAGASAWLSLPDNVKGQIRDQIIRVLGSENAEARSAATQVVSTLGAIDLPNGQWQDLIPHLSQAAITDNVPAHTREAVVQTLGFLCQNLDSGEHVSPENTNQILTAVVRSMQPNETDQLKLVGTTAMFNMLGFASANFANPAECKHIMDTVCGATQSTNVQVRHKAYEAIAFIAQIYYDNILPHMEQLYKLTVQTIMQDEEVVALTALEFWSSLCDEELERMYEDESQGGQQPSTNHGYIKNACRNPPAPNAPNLLQLLFQCIQKQEDGQDEDSWNLAMAAGTCLALVSQCIKEEIIAPVVGFLQTNIQLTGPDHWRQREAAVLAFGSMMDGPSPDALKNVVQQGLSVLFRLMDPAVEASVMVRDTTSWTVGMICQFHMDSLPVDEVLVPLVQQLHTRLDDVPSVARNVCFAITYLSQNFKADADLASNALSQFFTEIIRKLFATSMRADCEEFGLSGEAYEAIMALIEAAAQDQFSSIIEVLQYVLKLLNDVTTQLMAGTQDSESKSSMEKLQMRLCSVLLVIVQRVGGTPSINAALYDDIMLLMLKLLDMRGSPAQSDAFLVIGMVAHATCGDFQKYMEQFFPRLERGLRNRDEPQVCSAAVASVGDVCRAVEAQVQPYCAPIVNILIENLQDGQLDRNVKPPALGVFGDLALAIGLHYEVHLEKVMRMLQSAAQANFPLNDEDLVEYQNKLREAILEAISSIFQGLNDKANIAKVTELLRPHFQWIVLVIINISQQVLEAPQLVDDAVIKNAVGVIGDVCDVLGEEPKAFVKGHSASIQALFDAALASHDSSTLQTAQWAQSIVR